MIWAYKEAKHHGGESTERHGGVELLLVMPKSREGEQGQMYTSETYGSNDLTPPASPIVHSVWTHQWTYPSMKLAPSWCNNVFSLAPLPGDKIFKTSSLGGYFISKPQETSLNLHVRKMNLYGDEIGGWVAPEVKSAPENYSNAIGWNGGKVGGPGDGRGEALRTCLITQSSPWQLVEVSNWLTKE